jgi:glycosyltransferase involved in cell wall biosynthesis
MGRQRGRSAKTDHRAARRGPGAKGAGLGWTCDPAGGRFNHPRKAFGLLVESLSGLQHLDWRLRLVGASHRSPPTAAALVEQIAARGLERRVDLLGELSGEDLEAAFATSDVFVSPSLFEGYGMALAEAMAHGLPIVMTTAGAAASTVPDAAALKLAPLDVLGLRMALQEIIADVGVRQKLSDESWRAGQNLPQWGDTAGKIAVALESAGRFGPPVRS